MTKLTIQISMSLDGFVAAPNAGVEYPLGEGGDRLHEWVFGLASWREEHGQEGGTTDVDDAIIAESVRKVGRETVTKPDGTSYTFVTDGIESALEQARLAATDKNVAVAGGANVAQQYLKAGLFDNLEPGQVELERTRMIESPAVTHLTYRVVK
jgi:hypothetical protein